MDEAKLDSPGSFDEGDAAQDWRALALDAAKAGNHALAIECYEKAIVFEPGDSGLYLGLGNEYAFTGDRLRAVESYGKALQLAPHSGVCWNNLGNVFLELKDAPNAANCYENAVRFEPGDSGFRYNLGRTLDTLGRHVEAREHLMLATERNPSHADAWINLGNAQQNLGAFDEALGCFNRALELTDRQAEVHVNRAMVLLNRGEFREGWREYEYRWETGGFSAYKRRSFGAPQWEGESLAGKTILLHTEQGFGDAIQFARFIPTVSSLGAEVFLEVEAPLRRLLEGVVQPGHLLTRGEALPACNYHCSLISLPLALGLEIDTIPCESYLKVHVPEAISARVRRALFRVDGEGRKLRVGLCWRGNPTHRWDRIRSLDLARLDALAGVSGVQWVSLQRDATREEQAVFSERFGGVVLSEELMEDFLAIAGVIEELDVVVAVDTATAHLAGAMGKSVWLLLPPFNDWRWHAHLAESPWYPSARFFRQTPPGEWAGAVEAVVAELTALDRSSGTYRLGRESE
jgi:Tfp pilus assembly protein PilF